MSDGWAFDRLASRRAILFADVVESVRLFSRKGSGNIDRWHHYCDQVRQQTAPALRGRVVRTAGDSLLLDFESATQAVLAAFALHRQLGGCNPEQPGPDTMSLRIGLHLDDVVADQDDLWGSGVNLAARLATLPQPGQTVASAALRSELADGVVAHIQDMGLRYLKHIEEPVRAFLLSEPGSQRSMPLPSAEDLRPSVAVVPFVALPADPEHDALGHAMADDIIASLSRHPGLRVLSRASTAAVRGQALELKRLRELLGASFLLTGQFYVRGKRVRLSAELCELRDGQVLWSGGVAGEVDALFEGQDELVPHLVAQVSQHVMAHELARVRSLPMDSLASYSLFLGAQGLLNSLVANEFQRSREALEHLTERHPRQAAPHAALTQWHVFKVLQGWTEDADAEVTRARRHAALAMDKDPLASRTWVADGTAKVFAERDFEGAGLSFHEAIRLDPHCATAWARLSECESEAGAHHQSLTSSVRAIELSPLDPHRFVYECYAARSCYKMGEYLLATDWARASVRGNAMHAVPHRILVASLWFAGQEVNARAAAADLLRLMPATRATDGLSAGSLKPTITPFMRALHAAGVPM